MTWFQIYAVLAPLQVIPVALFVVWLTRWLEAREDRRHAEEDAKRR